MSQPSAPPAYEDALKKDDFGAPPAVQPYPPAGYQTAAMQQQYNPYPPPTAQQPDKPYYADQGFQSSQFATAGNFFSVFCFAVNIDGD